MTLLNRAVLICTTLLITGTTHASTYQYQGKEITKGQAVMVLAKDPNAVITKQDQVILDTDKGTLKNKPKTK